MAKRLPSPLDDDDLAGIEAVNRLAGWARKFIGVISGVLGVFFAWVQLKEVPFTEILEQTSPEFLTTTALIIYYACWIGGTNFDVRIQQRVYVADPKSGNLTIETIFITTIFFIVTILLLYVSKNTKAFAVLLAVFVVANIYGWRHIVARVKPAANASRNKFASRNNLFRLEQLNLVQTYMTGKWQMHRFWTMLGLIAVTNIVCLFASVRAGIANLIFSLGVNVPFGLHPVRKTPS
jgi:hypothetical protein